MVSPEPRRKLIQGRLSALTSDLDRYVDAYDERVPFTTQQLRLHRQTIALRRDANGAGEAIDSAAFLMSLRSTLEAWGLGVRGSKLAPQREFDEAIRSARAQIEALDGFLIDDPGLPVDVGERVWRVIESIGVVDNRAKLVAGTKWLLSCGSFSDRRWPRLGVVRLRRVRSRWRWYRRTARRPPG